jgi:tRNA pseudouridine55 synthase
MDGFINVLKPPGMTSHDVVSFVRQLLGIKKAGHTGTLDPGAAGVMLICCGKATRLIEYLDHNKSYRAEITFGISSSTGDSFGELNEVRVPAMICRDQVKAVLPRFIGDINQIPPMTSAIRHQGKKLYKLARQGIEVERKPRLVKVYSIELKQWHGGNTPKAILDIHCSAGTYIRTLCQDIGKELGCGAYMSFLLRTGVGSYNITQSATLEELRLAVEAGKNILTGIREAMSFLPEVEVWEGAVKSVCSGAVLYNPGVKSISGSIKPDSIALLVFKGQVLGVCRALFDEQKKMFFKPLKILVH